jgi:hypothetical protein
MTPLPPLDSAVPGNDVNNIIKICRSQVRFLHWKAKIPPDRDFDL